MKISPNKLFLEQSALLPPKLKPFFLLCHVKAGGRNIPEHPDIINASLNLRKNYGQNLDNAFLLPLKFPLLLQILTLNHFCHEN